MRKITERKQPTCTSQISSMSVKVTSKLQAYPLMSMLSVLISATNVHYMLLCQLETGNPHDPYTVSVTERGTIVSHLPQAIFTVCTTLSNWYKAQIVRFASWPGTHCKPFLQVQPETSLSAECSKRVAVFATAEKEAKMQNILWSAEYSQPLRPLDSGINIWLQQ